MKDWSKHALRALSEGEAVVLVTVAAVHGSAPREPGARMLVGGTGQWGTIGGGNLEYTAAGDARALLESGAAGPLARDYSLGPKLDQCCGGHVTLVFEPLSADDRHWLEAVARAARARTGERRIVPLMTEQKPYLAPAGSREDHLEPGEHVALLSVAGGRHILPRVDPRDLAAIIEPVRPPDPVLFMFGAGHVGRAVAAIVAGLPLDVVWIDGREDAFPEKISPNIAVWRLEPLEAVAEAPPDALYLVFTHSHPLDFDITARILARGDARYVGLIGSETKRARFVKRFRDDLGLTEERIARLTCPIGLDGPPGKEPEVIALGVAAEVMRAARESGR